MPKVLALTTDGHMTYCSCPPELRGKGRCNHIEHQEENETTEEFIKRVGLKEKDNYTKDCFGHNLNKKITIEIKTESNTMKYNGKIIDLANNDDPLVRKEIAKKGYCLDKLINDKDFEIREVIAEQGYGLDTLINDGAWEVRAAVARQGFGLDKLVDDKSHYVRLAVASQGYGYDKLINDEDETVRHFAKLYKKD